MFLYDKRVIEHLLNGGKVKRVCSDVGCFNGKKVKFLEYEQKICLEDTLRTCGTNAVYDDGDNYAVTCDDLTTDGWKIVEPEYDWDKIIANKVLCVFSYDKYDKDVIISTLAQHDRNIRYFTTGGYCYSYCKPFNPSDFNIAKDSKEYEK